MDNGYTLGFQGDTSVKYTDVVVEGDAMTMVVHIFGGRRFTIKATMVIFINNNNNYSIHTLDDYVPEVSYHTSPKDWMDQSLFFQYFMELQAYQPDIHCCTKYL